MEVYWVRVYLSIYEELFILQDHIYDIPEDIVTEVKRMSCLASWWWRWGFSPAVRDGADGGDGWCWGFDKTPALINKCNLNLDII